MSELGTIAANALPSVVVVGVAYLGFRLKLENRLTALETKMDLIIERIK